MLSLRKERVSLNKKRRYSLNQKGVILLIATVVVAMLLVLTGVYFSGLITEKGFADRQRFILQATALAEAGLSQGVVELRKQIRTDLKLNVEIEKSSAVFEPYTDEDTADKDSLDFLCDFAGFTRTSDEEVTLSISSLPLEAGVSGGYTGNIIIRKPKDEFGDDIEAYSPMANVFKFPYQFIIEAVGTVTKTTPPIQKLLRLVPGEVKIEDSDVRVGEFEITVQRGNFARYALFTFHHRAPWGATVWFTERTNFTGPVHTNERFSFANNPGAHFTEEVTQHYTKARFYNNGWSILKDSESNPPYDVPIFDSGFSRGVDELNLESAITQADLKTQALGDMTEPESNGIYVPNNGTSLTGGIYIRGNSTIEMQVDDDGNAVYTITQGGDTKIITLDYDSKQTTIQTAQGTDTYSGLPEGVDGEGVIIYAKDNITNFSGIVQKDSQVTVSSEKDIIINNHIHYQEYNEGPPVNAEGYTNLLGIISWGGDVRIGTSAPDDLEIHGIVMAPDGVFTVDNFYSGSPRGEVTLLGGIITDYYGPFGTFSGTTPISGYGRNFVYDARMLAGMAPPYFPVLTNFVSFDDGGLDRKPVWEDRG